MNGGLRKISKYKKLSLLIISFCLVAVLFIVNFACLMGNNASVTAVSNVQNVEAVTLADEEEFSDIDNKPYYIKNVQVNEYLQLDNDVESPEHSPGVITELWDFNYGNFYQLWFINRVDSVGSRTYYSITSYSGLSLAVQEKYLNSDSKSIVQEYYTSEYRQQWYFEKEEGNTYIIRPRSGEAYSADWCMCAGFNLFGIVKGLNVEQKKYNKDSDYKDTWRICKYTSSAELEAQEQNNWCWDACVRMVTMRYMDPQISQATLAYKIFKNKIVLNPTAEQINSVNLGATNDQIVAALNYTLGVSDCFGAYKQIYSEENLYKVVTRYSCPIIVRLGYYVNGVRLSGHAVVVNYVYESSSYGCYVCEIFDPWPVKEGRTYWCSYESLRNGNNVVGEWDHRNTNYMWDGIIVPKTIYGFPETIPFTL